MNKDLVNGLVVFGIGVLAYWGSQVFNRREAALSENPALYPQLLALVLCVFGVALSIQGLIRKESSKQVPRGERTGVQRSLYVVLTLVGYAAGIYLFGFILPSLLFMFGVPILLGSSRKTAFLVSVPLTIALYVTFFLLFKVPVPQGAIFR